MFNNVLFSITKFVIRFFLHNSIAVGYHGFFLHNFILKSSLSPTPIGLKLYSCSMLSQVPLRQAVKYTYIKNHDFFFFK